MEEINTAIIANRTVKGVLALTIRYFFISIIGIAAQLILQYKLDPGALGVYAIVNAVIAILMYFSDIGLAAALIQKKEQPTKDDLKTTFTIQQILILTLILCGFIFSPYVASVYNLDKPGLLLFQALLVSFFFSSLKTIPSVLLERKLDFNKLVIPQIFETIIFHAVTIIFVLQGFGITSYAYAVLARGISGLIVIYILVPWKPNIGIVRSSAESLLKFGFPFQTNSILALLKDKLLIVILGVTLTRGEIGYIYNFAQYWASIPLRFAMDSVIRVTFPSYSRLQHDTERLGLAIEKSLFLIITIVSPMLIGLIVFSPHIVNVIPKYEKWEPALISLWFFSAEAMLSSISTPLTNVLNAIGKIKVTLNLMIFWTIATWIATFIFIKFFGFQGVSMAVFFVSLSVFYVVYLVRKYVEFNIFGPVFKPLIAGLVMGIFAYITGQLIIKDAISLMLTVFLTMLIYLIILYIIAKKELKNDIIVIMRILRRKE